MRVDVNSTPWPLSSGKETLYPVYRRLGGPHVRSGRVWGTESFLTATRFEPRTAQPTASRITDYANVRHELDKMCYRLCELLYPELCFLCGDYRVACRNTWSVHFEEENTRALYCVFLVWICSGLCVVVIVMQLQTVQNLFLLWLRVTPAMLLVLCLSLVKNNCIRKDDIEMC
jgi:hypothetical protein